MLTETDRGLLEVLCAHRVVRQDQLARLFPEIPERTLRYRTRRLHDLGLMGRTRPYRDRGSAANHHWPTRHADNLMCAEPSSRGGERQAPNPVFLAHTSALTEFYIALYTNARQLGFESFSYAREKEAREPFTDGARERALAPDITFGLMDEQDHELVAFVEVDLGTMSHPRLRAKADLYAAYVRTEAWREHHAYLPALLFLTTTNTRAQKFLAALASALSYKRPSRGRRRAFTAAAAGIARTPHQLMTEPCLADLDGHTGLGLLDILNAAYAPYEQMLAREREEHETEEAERQALLDDPERLRAHLHEHKYALAAYLRALNDQSIQAIELLLAADQTPAPQEQEVLQAIAHDLAGALPELLPSLDEQPCTVTTQEIAQLVRHYTDTQAQQIRTLAAQHGDGPSLQRAWDQLNKRELLNPSELHQLPHNAKRDEAGRRDQHQRRAIYLQWREQTARALARKTGPLRCLTHPPETFYPQLDHEHLKVCNTCNHTIYPGSRKPNTHLYDAPITCHYCTEPHATRPYNPHENASTESEAHQ